MCTPLLASLKDLATFVWFRQDLMLGVAPSYLWQVVAPCSFLVWRSIVTFLVSTNAPSRYSDEVQLWQSVCLEEIWRRASCLTLSIFLFDGVAFLSFQGILRQWEGSCTVSRQEFWKWHLVLGFGFLIFPFDLVNLKALCGASGGKRDFLVFWPCDLTGCMWQVRGSGFWILVLVLWPNKLYVAS